MENIKFNRNEIAGSFGDLGLFVPIVAALVILNGINATVVLFSAGILYIASGLYFRVPMPVQPLKAVASIAIALGATPQVISASGLWMGIILALIAVTPAATHLSRIFSRPVVRGIQLAIGIFLIRAGYGLLMKKQLFINQETDGIFSGAGVNILLALAAILIIFLFRKDKRIPACLLVLGLGLVAGVALGGLTQFAGIAVRPESFDFAIPSVKDLYIALVLLVLPQVPMTLANSIIATSDISVRYFGKKAKRVTPRRLLTSLSVTNLCISLFGGIPVCHGAGGMTAHYRFGARTAGSNIIIGTFLIFLSLVFGRYAIAILALIPSAIYAVLMIYLGIQHALLISDLLRKEYFFVPVSMGTVALFSSNLALTIGFGYLVEFLYKKSMVLLPRDA